MDWDQLKDIKVIASIITFIAFVVGVVTQTRSDTAETELKRSEAKKINRELKNEELKKELRRIKTLIDKIIKML